MARCGPRSRKAILSKTEETYLPGWMGLSDPITEAIKQEKRPAAKRRVKNQLKAQKGVRRAGNCSL